MPLAGMSSARRDGHLSFVVLFRDLTPPSLKQVLFSLFRRIYAIHTAIVPNPNRGYQDWGLMVKSRMRVITAADSMDGALRHQEKIEPWKN